MRRIKMSEVISRSVDRSAAILFKPFQLKKWLILSFIALFAGTLSFGSINGGSGGRSSSPKSQKETQSQAPQSQPSQAGTEETSQAKSETDETGTGPFSENNIIFWIFIATIICLVSSVFILTLFWLSAHYSFIWFNAIAANDASIIGPFHKHRAQGRSLFKAFLGYMAIFLSAAALMVLWGVLIAVKAGVFQPGFTWSVPIFFRLFWMPLTGILLVIIASVFISTAIMNFTVMIMALDKTPFLKAFGKTLRFFKDNPMDIALFYLVIFLLWVACSAMVMVIALILLLAFVLAGALLAGIGYLTFMVLLKLKIIFVAYCIIIGLPWFATLFVAIICAELPLAVFLRSFSIEYLCSFEGGYTYEMLDRYAQERSTDRSKTIVILPVIFMSLLSFVLVVGLLAAIAIPNFIKARDNANAALANKCTTNLRAIETAKKMWAEESGVSQGSVPTWENIVPSYLIKVPSCPKGGTYTVGPAAEPPQCSIGDNSTQRTDDDHIIKE